MTRIALVLLAVVTLGCSDGAGPDVVASVSIGTPNSPFVMRVGDLRNLTVQLLNSSGGVAGQRPVLWTSSAEAVASVGSASGVVIAKSPGDATITATSEGKSASVALSVRSLVVGVWTGVVSTQTLTMTLVENSGVVTGAGTLTGNTGALTISGVYLSPTLTLTFTSAGYQPFSMTAIVNGDRMTGTVTGSGFNNQTTLVRQ